MLWKATGNIHRYSGIVFPFALGRELAFEERQVANLDNGGAMLRCDGLKKD